MIKLIKQDQDKRKDFFIPFGWSEKITIEDQKMEKEE